MVHAATDAIRTSTTTTATPKYSIGGRGVPDFSVGKASVIPCCSEAFGNVIVNCELWVDSVLPTADVTMAEAFVNSAVMLNAYPAVNTRLEEA